MAGQYLKLSFLIGSVCLTVFLQHMVYGGGYEDAHGHSRHYPNRCAKGPDCQQYEAEMTKNCTMEQVCCTRAGWQHYRDPEDVHILHYKGYCLCCLPPKTCKTSKEDEYGHYADYCS